MRAMSTSRARNGFLIVFAATALIALISGFGAGAIAFLGPSPLNEAQEALFDNLTSLAMFSAGSIIGLLGSRAV